MVTGRYVRNILDKIAIEQSQRVATVSTADKDLITITDVKNVPDRDNTTGKKNNRILRCSVMEFLKEKRYKND